VLQSLFEGIINFMPTVYKLISPITKQPYYVGFTIQDINVRLIGHLYQPTNTTKKLMSIGLIPDIQAIESGEDITKQNEKEWIRKLSLEGYVLDNIDGLKNYQNRDAIFTLPNDLLNTIPLSIEDKYKTAISIALKELPETSSVPIVLRLKFILEWALSQ